MGGQGIDGEKSGKREIKKLDNRGVKVVRMDADGRNLGRKKQFWAGLCRSGYNCVNLDRAAAQNCADLFHLRSSVQKSAEEKHAASCAELPRSAQNCATQFCAAGQIWAVGGGSAPGCADPHRVAQICV